MYKIKNNVKSEEIINRSKFITHTYYVKDIIECNNIINSIKNEYKDATHNCYAYKINNLKRFNDDKEPNGTAGMPILNVIETNDLNHILIIVTRYFGGVKLGASNLLRTYVSCANNAVKLSGLEEEKQEEKIKIIFDYSNVNNVNYILKDYNITYKEYNDDITYEFIYETKKYPKELDNYIKEKELIN